MMKGWGWFGIGALIGLLYGYRAKIKRIVGKELPPLIEFIRNEVDVADIYDIYNAVNDPESRHEAAVEILLQACRRKGANWVTPGTAELFVANIDEIIRRIQQ